MSLPIQEFRENQCLYHEKLNKQYSHQEESPLLFRIPSELLDMIGDYLSVSEFSSLLFLCKKTHIRYCKTYKNREQQHLFLQIENPSSLAQFKKSAVRLKEKYSAGLTSVRHINLILFNIGNSYMKHNIPIFPNLESIALTCTDIENQDFKEIVVSHKTLTNILLIGKTKLTHCGLDDILTCHPILKQLDLSTCIIICRSGSRLPNVEQQLIKKYPQIKITFPPP